MSVVFGPADLSPGYWVVSNLDKPFQKPQVIWVDRVQYLGAGSRAIKLPELLYVK